MDRNQGKGSQGSFTGGEYRGAEHKEVGGVGPITQALNAQPRADFIPWEWRAVEGSVRGGPEHNGRGQERHRGTRMGEPGRRLRLRCRPGVRESDSGRRQ